MGSRKRKFRFCTNFKTLFSMDCIVGFILRMDRFVPQLLSILKVTSLPLWCKTRRGPCWRSWFSQRSLDDNFLSHSRFSKGRKSNNQSPDYAVGALKLPAPSPADRCIHAGVVSSLGQLWPFLVDRWPETVRLSMVEMRMDKLRLSSPACVRKILPGRQFRFVCSLRSLTVPGPRSISHGVVVRVLRSRRPSVQEISSISCFADWSVHQVHFVNPIHSNTSSAFFRSQPASCKWPRIVEKAVFGSKTMYTARLELLGWFDQHFRRRAYLSGIVHVIGADPPWAN